MQHCGMKTDGRIVKWAGGCHNNRAGETGLERDVMPGLAGCAAQLAGLLKPSLVRQDLVGSAGNLGN